MRPFTSDSNSAMRLSMSACQAWYFSCTPVERARRSAKNSSSNTASFAATPW